MGEEALQVHHMSKPGGEKLEMKCPHCQKTIIVSFKTMELDEDTLVFRYRKKSK